jgi:dolichol-phosphate mannosyltransferase
VRTADTLVVLATYNEQGNIGLLLDHLLALPAQLDILVVDDSSTDGTTAIATSRAASDRRIQLIVRPQKLGIGSAHKLGWVVARRSLYSRIVTLDADLSHDPGDLLKLIEALDTGADVAIGSRFIRGGKLDYHGWRLFLSRSANHLARVALKMPLFEYTTSFRAARLDRIPIGLVETLPSDGYGFFMTCAVRFVQNGFVVAEVPIYFRKRHSGRSKLSLLEILRGALVLLCLAIRRVPPKISTLRFPVGSCSSCRQPYLTSTAPGRVRCLVCFHSATQMRR